MPGVRLLELAGDTTTGSPSVRRLLGDLLMNPPVLTRLDQLEQEWQQRLLMQPSSGQADETL